MKNNTTIKTVLIALAITTGLAACRKDDDIISNPQPVEQELITTMKLVVTGDGGFNETFVYKIENGFNSNGQGTVQIDTLKLEAEKNYEVSIQMLNEKESPAEDVTEEILKENTEHLFLYVSEPPTGAGSVVVSNGSKDDDGKPFNQKVKLTTGKAGTGKLTVTLKHEPVDKEAATPDAAGGETDAEGTFPVNIY